MIENAQKAKYSVYMHTNLINGKVYIGKSFRNPVYRWGKDGSGYLRCSRGHNKVNQRHFASAIKKYGWENFKHEVLFKGLSSKEASEKEKELIRQYESNNPSKGYNMTEGGEGCAGRIVTQETRDLLKESLKKYKKIYQYDKKGNFIKEWRDCEEILSAFKVESDSNLYSHLAGKQKSFKGFIFKLEETDDVQYRIKTTAKSIRCYTLDGKYIKTYSSYQEAFKETGSHPSMIVRCLRKECVSSGGFVWKEDIGDYEDVIVPRKYEKNFSAVLQIDDFGNVVAEFDSIKEAKKHTSVADISAVCRGLRRKAGGYFWKYKYERKEVEKKRKWTKETCYVEAQKYATKTEFMKGSGGAYNVACAKGWLDDYVWFVDGRKRNAENQRIWTKITCYELAQKCKTRGEFKKISQSAYNVSRKNGWLKDYTWFENGHTLCWDNKRKWTREMCFEEAKKYASRGEFQKHSCSAYNASLKNGWLDDYTWMQRSYKSGKSNDKAQLELNFG